MTLFSEVIQEFYHYIENDVDFFNYFELDEDECMEVAGQRAMVLLKEAASYITRKLIVENVFSKTSNNDSDINGNDNNDAESMYFEETLTNGEINLLVKTMFLIYLQRDLTRLRTFHGVMTSSDLNMYSPANERKTFVEMVNQYENGLNIEISEYQMKDRNTGSYIQICE